METQQAEMDDSGCVQDESLSSKRLYEERGLLDLSDDVLLHVLQYCDACDLKALGFTCPRFGALVLDRSLWKSVDARRAACGRARFRWLVERGLHEGTVKLSLRGCALEARGCQGHRDSERSNKPSPQKYTSFAVPRSQESAARSAAPAHPVRQPAQFYIRASSSRQLPRNMAHPYWPDRRDVLPHPSGPAEPHASAAHCLGSQLCFTRGSLRRLVDKCPHLTTLSLDYGVIDARTTDLSHFPRSLTSLSLRGTKCYNLTTNKTMLFRINDHLPDLEHIDVSECEWLEPSALLPLSKLPKLRSLRARDCLRLSEFVAYASLATVRGFRALETLDLTGSPLGDTEAASFGWLRHLVSLSLGAGGRRGAVPAHHHYRAEPFADDDGLEDWEREEPLWYKSGPDEQDSDPEPEPDAAPKSPAEDTHVFTITFDRDNGPRVQHDVLHGNVLGIGHRVSNAGGNKNPVERNENAVAGNENAVVGNENAVAGNENVGPGNENPVAGNESAVDGNKNPVAKNHEKVNVARDNDATTETDNKNYVTNRNDHKNDEVSNINSNENAVNSVSINNDFINQSNNVNHDEGSCSVNDSNVQTNDDLNKSTDSVENNELGTSFKSDSKDTSIPNCVTNDEIVTNDGMVTNDEKVTNDVSVTNDKNNSIFYDVREYEFDDDDDGFNNFIPSRESSINMDEPIAGPSRACHNIAQNLPKTDENRNQNGQSVHQNHENIPINDKNITENHENESLNGESTSQDNSSKKLPGPSSETCSNIANVLKRPAEPDTEQTAKKLKVEMQKSVRFRRNLPPVVVMRDPNRPDVEIIQDLPMHELGVNPAENQPNPAENQPNPAENQPNLAENQPNPAENQPNPAENQPNQAGNGNDVVFYFNVGDGEQRNRAMRLPFIRNIVFAPPVPRAAPSTLITDNTILGYGVSDVLNVVRIGQNRLVLGIQDADKPNKSALKRLVCTGFSGITDLSLEHLLYAAPFLEYIDFSETNVTAEGVERFKLLRPNCEVVYSKFVQKQMYD